MRRATCGLLGATLLVTALVAFQIGSVHGAAGHATPQFQQQWQLG